MSLAEFRDRPGVIRHLLGADFRRMAPWLTFWWIYLAFHVWIIQRSYSTAHQREFEAWERAGFHPWFLLLILVPLLVQRDRPFGSRTFWLTRPIRGMDLFLAKGVFLSVLLLTPILLAQAAAMISVGLPLQSLPPGWCRLPSVRWRSWRCSGC